MLEARLKAHCRCDFFILFLTLQQALTMPRKVSASAPRNEANNTKTSANDRIA